MRLVLCPACRRHAFAHETACPFCAHALDVACPALEPTETGSRSQRYAAALAGVVACAIGAVSGCAPPPVAEGPRDPTFPVSSASVSPNGSPPPGGGNSSLTFGGPADDTPPSPTGTATQRRPPPPPPDDDWRNRRRGGGCVTQPNGRMICPPYGCVFPDEDCDVLRA